MTDDEGPRFFCDAMLGGLARWLRAAGYDAEFEYGIDDGVLVARAMASGQVLLSSDGPMFERNVIKDGTVKALYIPQQMSKEGQLRFVLDALGLPRRSPRCMACGGKLTLVPKHEVMGEAPPGASETATSSSAAPAAGSSSGKAPTGRRSKRSSPACRV